SDVITEDAISPCNGPLQGGASVLLNGPSGQSANLLTGRSVVRTRSLSLVFLCLGLGNLAVSQPSSLLRVAWQLGTEGATECTASGRLMFQMVRHSRFRDTLRRDQCRFSPLRLHSLGLVPEHNPMRRAIRRQVKVSLRSDHEVWWTQKAKEMEGAQKAGNARRLFQLIRATGPRKPPVSESIKHQNGTTISNMEERLDRWAEYLEQLMSCWLPPALICSPQRHRAPCPDDLPPTLLKDRGEVLSQRLSDLFACIWEKESVPDNWGESVTVPVFKKGARCGNHRGISLTPVVTRLLASIVLRRITVAREILTREQQAGFRRGRSCVDQIFTLRQVLEQRHTYKRPTILFLSRLPEGMSGSVAECAAHRPPHVSVGTIFETSQYIFIKETTHKVVVEEFSATLQLNVLHQAPSCFIFYLVNPKKGKASHGLSKNFQQPYE
ncbi:LOW QUALITY PROTEIN: hypothetical protein T265_13747, partial [Opisthorchis viverrini]